MQIKCPKCQIPMQVQDKYIICDKCKAKVPKEAGMLLTNPHIYKMTQLILSYITPRGKSKNG